MKKPPVTDVVLDRIPIDRSSPVPLYYQVAQYLEKAIEAGELTPGMRLENEVELADQLGLSRPTMRRAMEYLVDKGLVVRRRGIGTRIVSPKVRRTLELSSLHDDLTRDGQRPTTQVLSVADIPASTEVAQALDVAEGSDVTHLVRVRSAMDQPIAMMTNYLRAGLVKIDLASLEDRGLYDIIRTSGIQLHSATQVVGARSATASEARMLGETRGAALLTMQRTTYDDHGVPVEYGKHVYAASRYSFQMSLLSP